MASTALSSTKHRRTRFNPVRALIFSAALGVVLATAIDARRGVWTPASFQAFYTDQLNTFAATFASLPAPTTNRTHCIAWSDLAIQPQVELGHGICLDTSYYYEQTLMDCK